MSRLPLSFAAIVLLLPAVGLAQSPTPADAITLEREGRLAEAAGAWRRVTTQNPNDAEAWASLGVVLSKQQEYAQASVAYRKALSLDPELPGISLNLGLAEFKQGKFEGAIPPLRAALSADSFNFQARALLGMSEYGAGKFREASKNLELAVNADPGNSELHDVLAQSCLSAKKYDCALSEFRWILKRNPDSASTHMLIGEALDGMGKTPEAIEEFTSAAKKDSQAPEVNFGLGYLYWKMRHYDDAGRAFEAELSVNPANPQALAYLGDVQMKQGNPDKALSLLKDAVRLRQDLRIAYVDIGAILTEQKQYQEALAALLRGEKLDPEQPEVHYRLGRLYQAMGNAESAEREFTKVKHLHQKAEDDIADKMSGHQPASHP